jgi:acyl dehydratase
MKYFEDFAVGEEATVGAHLVTEEELTTFARAWDPQPSHTDRSAAVQSPFGGLIASGAHVIAISVRLLVTSVTEPVAVVAALGWDHVRFLAPVRVGDTLTLTRRCIEARPSQSHPERGVVRNALLLTNQSGVRVLSYEDSLLVTMRAPRGARPGSAA